MPRNRVCTSRSGSVSRDSSRWSSVAPGASATNHRNAASCTCGGTVPSLRRERIRPAASSVDVGLVSTQKSAAAAYCQRRAGHYLRNLFIRGQAGKRRAGALCEPAPDGRGVCGEQHADAISPQALHVFRVHDYAAPGANNDIMCGEPGDSLAFQRPEPLLPVIFEDIGDRRGRFSVR